MIFSTPAKVASGIAVTSVSVVGATFTYKYMSSPVLYQPDRDAIAATTWNISSTAPTTTGQPKTVTFSVSTSSNAGNPARSWTCTLIATATPASGETVTVDGIKEDLKSYFGDLTIPTSGNAQTSSSTPNQEHRTGFVNSCARNRKSGTTPNDTSVQGELKLEIIKQSTQGNKYKFNSEELKSVFNGTWTNKSETKST